MSEKVILAYSGGLDTTAIIPWLKETYGYDVVCCCIDVGQGNELEDLDQRAISCVQASFTLKILQMNLQMITSCLALRLVQFMKTAIFLVHQWLDH